MAPGLNKEPIRLGEINDHPSITNDSDFTKTAALTQKIGNEWVDRLSTLFKMEEMPADTKRGEILPFVKPDRGTQVTDWEVEHLCSWNWQIWKMGQKHGPLNGAPSVALKKTLLRYIEKNGSEYWHKVTVEFVLWWRKSLHNISVSLEAKLSHGYKPVKVAHWLTDWSRVSWQKSLMNLYSLLTLCPTKAWCFPRTINPLSNPASELLWKRQGSFSVAERPKTIK